MFFSEQDLSDIFHGKKGCRVISFNCLADGRYASYWEMRFRCGGDTYCVRCEIPGFDGHNDEPVFEAANLKKLV